MNPFGRIAGLADLADTEAAELDGLVVSRQTLEEIKRIIGESRGS